MFCHECGARLEKGAAFCHECGAKVIQNGTSAEEQVTVVGGETTAEHNVSKEKTTVNLQKPQISMPGKIKSKKVLAIIGAIVGFLMVLGLTTVLSDEKKENNYEYMTEMAEVYESEDLRFEYPKAWEKADGTDESCVVALINTDIYSFISVWKLTEMPMTAESLYDIEDSYLVENFVTEDMNAVESISLVTINDYPAREVIYSSADANVDKAIYRSYFYAVDSVLYRIDFVKKETNPVDVDKVFDSVLDSYVIKADSVPDLSTDDGDGLAVIEVQESQEISLEDIFFKDMQVSELLEMSSDDIIQYFGHDYLSGKYYEMVYDDIIFCMTEDGQVLSIDGEYPEYFQVNGQKLDNMDTVTEIFGEDYSEDDFSRTYYYPTYRISFTLDYPTIIICKENTDTYDYSEASEKTLDDYLILSGTYTGIMEGYSLGVGIYTSQEE